MGLSQPRAVFGVHSVSPYNPLTGEFYGILKVLGGSSLSLTGELIKLMGGSQKYAWDIEEGNTTAELTLKIREYPDFLFELFLGKAPTAVNTPDTDGVVSTLTNKKGSSVVHADGIASVAAIPSTGAANLKFGRYLAKVASATTIDIYCASDIDFNRGTDETFEDDSLKVHAGATITQGGNTDIASLGLRFVGGAGTIGMTVGDTATFEVLPPFTKSMSVRVGGASDTFPAFGAVILGKQKNDGQMFEMDAFQCKASGMPIGFEANAYSETEIKAELFIDTTKNGIFDVRWIKPS